MPRTSTTTYDDVARVATAQVAAGTNPTNATIKSALGGSFTTIAPLLKRWKTEHQHPTTNDSVLPDTIAAAITTEINRQVAEATTKLTADLADASATIDGLTKENEDTEKELAEVRAQLKQTENTLSTCNGVLTEVRKQLTDEQAKATKAIEDFNNAKVDLARSEGYKEIVESLRTEVAALRELQATRSSKK